MGATTFTVTVTAPTPATAFDLAVTDARHEYGHDIYSGTIGTKDGYAYLRTPEGVDHQKWLNAVKQAAWDNYDIQPGLALLAQHIGQKRASQVVDIINDKWGVAMCVQSGDDEWTFLGTAPC